MTKKILPKFFQRMIDRKIEREEKYINRMKERGVEIDKIKRREDRLNRIKTENKLPFNI